jgi:uncharacterized protein (TIGR02611 family)
MRRRASARAAAALLRRATIAVVGSTVILLGLAMVVLPVPAILVIAGGLAILATEFLWARRLLVEVRARTARLARRPRSVVR